LCVSDACPLEPETYNRYLDADGCPDSVDAIGSTYAFPDADGDGIDDRWDQCIDEQENYNGYLDWDGCPDVKGTTAGDILDSDYDGIPDHLDKCPTLAERYNGFQDDDGCPDSIDFKIVGDSDGDGIYCKFQDCKDKNHLNL